MRPVSHQNDQMGSCKQVVTGRSDSFSGALQAWPSSNACLTAPPSPPPPPHKAAADTFGMRVVVLTSFASSPVVAVEPETPGPQSATRTLYLSFWAEVGGEGAAGYSQGACRQAPTVLACRPCRAPILLVPWCS